MTTFAARAVPWRAKRARDETAETPRSGCPRARRPAGRRRRPRQRAPRRPRAVRGSPTRHGHGRDHRAKADAPLELGGHALARPRRFPRQPAATPSSAPNRSPRLARRPTCGARRAATCARSIHRRGRAPRPRACGRPPGRRRRSGPTSQRDAVEPRRVRVRPGVVGIDRGARASRRAAPHARSRLDPRPSGTARTSARTTPSTRS